MMKGSGVPGGVRTGDIGRPPEALTARGHEEPFSVQFSVFLANRVGKLDELLEAFGRREVPVDGLSIVDSSDWAVIRIVSSDPGRARQAMGDLAIPFTETPVLLVELAEPGDMVRVCRLLVTAEINIHFAYPLITRRRENAVLVVHVDDAVEARSILLRHGIGLVGYEDRSPPEEPPL